MSKDQSSLINGGWLVYMVIGILWVICSIVALKRICEAHDPEVLFQFQYNKKAKLIRRSTNVIVLLIFVNEFIWLFYSIPLQYHTLNDLIIHCLVCLCYLLYFGVCLAESIKQIQSSFSIRIVHMVSNLLIGISWYGSLYIIVSEEQSWSDIKENTEFQCLSISLLFSLVLSCIALLTPPRTYDHQTIDVTTTIASGNTDSYSYRAGAYQPLLIDNNSNSSNSNHNNSNNINNINNHNHMSSRDDKFSDEKGPECLEPYASIYSILSYSWVDSILTKGMEIPLEMRHIFELVDQDKCDVNADIVEKAWKKEFGIVSKKCKPSTSTSFLMKIYHCFCSCGDNKTSNTTTKPHLYKELENDSIVKCITLFRALFIRGYGMKFISLAFLRLCGILVTYAQPLVLYQIILAVSKGEEKDGGLKGVHMLRMISFSFALFALNFSSVLLFNFENLSFFFLFFSRNINLCLFCCPSISFFFVHFLCKPNVFIIV